MAGTDNAVLIALGAILTTPATDRETWRKAVRDSLGRTLTPEEYAAVVEKVNAFNARHSPPPTDSTVAALKIENYPP